MGWVTLPREFQFGDAGVKPAGEQVEINWNHWAAQGLDFYTPFIGGNTFDIARDRAGVLQVDSDFRVVGGKEVLFCENSLTHSGVKYASDTAWDHTQPWTMAIRFSCEAFTATDYPALFGFSTTGASSTSPFLMMMSNDPNYDDFTFGCRDSAPSAGSGP